MAIGSVPVTSEPNAIVWPNNEISPDASGRVYVLPAVKSALVIVPVKLAVAVEVCGNSASLSVLAVVEPNTAAPVP